MVPTDTVGWVEDQLDEGGSAVLNYDAGGGVVWSVPFKDASVALAVPSWPMEKLGLTRNSTFAQVLDAVVNTELEGIPLQHKVRGHSMPLADSMRS